VALTVCPIIELAFRRYSLFILKQNILYGRYIPGIGYIRSGNFKTGVGA
jgi:hypothetical protein